MLRVIVVGNTNGFGGSPCDLFPKDSEVSIVTFAQTAEEAIHANRSKKPEAILVAMEPPMPACLDLLLQLVASRPVPILAVTFVNPLQSQGIALEAIKAGATDVVNLGRPEDHGEPESIKQEILRRLRRVANVQPIRRKRPFGESLQQEAAQLRPEGRVVAIGASTGGPIALGTVLKGLPRGFSCSILVVQHIALGFAPGLVDWLCKEAEKPVKLAEDWEPLRPGTIYFPPDDHHLAVSPLGRIVLTKAPPVGGHRPSVDYLMEAVARAYGPHAVGVVLTGMGKDGARGLLKIREAGGQTIAQDQATSLVFGMPMKAISLKAAGVVCPIDRVSVAILEALARMA